jgi:hypothetical protein
VPEAVRRLFRREGERRPDLRAVGKVESERGDADDFVGLSIERDRLADDRRIAAEPALPDSMTENGSAMLSRSLFGGKESAAERRLDPERSKEIGRYPEALHALGFVVAEHADVPPLHRDEALKRGGLSPPVEEVGR